MTTLNERIENNADLIFWCVHILGPDDVLAAPSHLAAVVRAREINQATHRKVDTPADILCFAYAAPWPHDAQSHFDGLKEWQS